MVGKSSKSKSKQNRASPYILRSSRTREIFLAQTEEDISKVSRQLKPELKAVTQQTWQAFRVSALFGLKYEKSKLAKYAKCIESCIEKEKKKNIKLLAGDESNYKVTLSSKDEFRARGEDPKAIKIEIVCKADKENEKPLFIGILMSFQHKDEIWESKFQDNDATFLPLFLASGKQIFMNAVMEFLIENFCCAVYPMFFSSLNLGWMLSMWAGYNAESGLKPLFLEYALPMKDLSAIQFSIEANSAIEIWNRIHKRKSSEMNAVEVNAFLSSLEQHFRTLICTDLAHFQLSSIGTSAVAVHRNGRIKIFCNAAVPYVLRHLTHLAQEFAIA